MIVSHADILLLACHAILTWQTVLSAKEGYIIDSFEKSVTYTCTWSLCQSAYSPKYHFKSKGKVGGGGGRGSQEPSRFGVSTIHIMYSWMKPSNSIDLHFMLVLWSYTINKLCTVKVLLKASDKINGVTFSATYV